MVYVYSECVCTSVPMHPRISCMQLAHSAPPPCPATRALSLNAVSQLQDLPNSASARSQLHLQLRNRSDPQSPTQRAPRSPESSTSSGCFHAAAVALAGALILLKALAAAQQATSKLRSGPRPLHRPSIRKMQKADCASEGANAPPLGQSSHTGSQRAGAPTEYSALALTPHDGAPPFQRGGAQERGAMTAERREATTRQRKRGFLVHWDYTHSDGDCFYASLAFLTSRTLMEVRSLTAGALREAFETQNDLWDQVHQRLMAQAEMHLHPRKLTEQQAVHAYCQWIGRKSEDTMAERGWADDVATTIAARTLSLDFECHHADSDERTVIPGRREGQGNPCQTLTLLFEGERSRGHYVPCTRLPSPQAIPRTLYFEPQVNQDCMIHSFNMLMGYPCLSAPVVHSWFEAQNPLLPPNQVAWKSSFNPGIHSSALNIYLHTNHALTTTMVLRQSTEGTEWADHTRIPALTLPLL